MLTGKPLFATAAILLAVACSPAPSGRSVMVAAPGSPGGLPLPSHSEQYYRPAANVCAAGYDTVNPFQPQNSNQAFRACVAHRPLDWLPPASDHAYWARVGRLTREGDPSPVFDAADPR
jgi:hypothetical protein